MDGWGFKLDQFAKLYAAKLGCNAKALTQALWGDFAFNAKTKRIVKIKPEQQQKPLFVQVRGETMPTFRGGFGRDLGGFGC